MKEIKEGTYKGTRIVFGNEKRILLNRMIKFLTSCGFQEISIPIIQFSELFKNKVGDENQNMMFNFSDRGGRDLCLAPEYTAVIQNLSKTYFKNQRDIKVFYAQECFRGEKPQAGRYRQFTQVGVEIINPTKDYLDELIYFAETLIGFSSVGDLIVNRNAVRGLDYYNGGVGFEIACDKLGNAKQICGGGSYDGGIGFAIGLDRIL